MFSEELEFGMVVSEAFSACRYYSHHIYAVRHMSSHALRFGRQLPGLAWLRSFSEDWSANPAAMPTARKFLIFGVMAFGQFMALFDIQIVSASLKDVQAGLAAGPDEISWVQTAYLMAELVMVPLSGYLANAMSTRGLFACSAALFTMSSLTCGLSWDMNSMIAFRAIQGFTGGAMIPMVFATGFTLFHGKQRALIPAILGAVSVLAPTLAPTAGGYITEFLDWRWLFFVNILPGVAVTLLALVLIRVDRAKPGMFQTIDWSHLAALAVFLGGLEYVLEEGPRYEWFTNTRIEIAGWCSFVGFCLFLERCFYSANPLVKLTPLRKPTFAFACVFNFVIGVGLFSSIYLIPVYLGRVRGFDSLQIGETVFVVGVAQMLGVAISAALSQRVDMRIMITFGLSLFAASLWLTSTMSSEWGFAQLLLPQALRGLALMLCIVPSVNMALSGFAPAELKFASGLFNVMRNLGGAVGIAAVNTLLQDQTGVAMLRIGEAMGHDSERIIARVGSLSRRLSATAPDPHAATIMAQGLLGRIAGREALTLAFDDVFRLLAWVFIIALVMVPFCRPSPNVSSPAEAGH
jgi:DHA2 family multidrug resistance protein